MARGKLVAALAIAAVLGFGNLNKAEAQWAGCYGPPVYRSYSVGYGPGWSSYNSIYTYSAGYYGVPGYYRTVGLYPYPAITSYPGFYSVQRVVVPAPVVRPVVVAPVWGPGWVGGFGPVWGGSGVSLRVGF